MLIGAAVSLAGYGLAGDDCDISFGGAQHYYSHSCCLLEKEIGG